MCEDVYACFALFVVRCLLAAVRGSLFVVCCVLCCLLCVVYGVMCVC